MATETALVIVLLALCAVLMWVIWYMVAHVSAASRAHTKLLHESMTHHWSTELSKDPQRAALAATLEERARMSMPMQPPAPQTWPDDAALDRI